MKVYSYSLTTKSFLGECRVGIGEMIASGRRPVPGVLTLQLGDPASQMAKSERKQVEKRQAEHAQQPFGTMLVRLQFVEDDAAVAGTPPPISPVHRRHQEQEFSSGLDSSIDSSMYESADDAEVAR